MANGQKNPTKLAVYKHTVALLLNLTYFVLNVRIFLRDDGVKMSQKVTKCM